MLPLGSKVQPIQNPRQEEFRGRMESMKTNEALESMLRQEVRVFASDFFLLLLLLKCENDKQGTELIDHLLCIDVNACTTLC